MLIAAIALGWLRRIHSRNGRAFMDAVARRVALIHEIRIIRIVGG